MAYNHFTYTPSTVTEDRSQFKFNKQIVTGAQLGWLYPMCKPVKMYPGSTLNIKSLNMEVRSGAMIAPLMSELYCDCFAFSVPNRIVWEHWKQFLGAVDDVLFDNLTEYQIPHFKYAMQLMDGNGALYRAGFDTGAENYQWNQCLACHFELPYPVATSDTSQNQYPTDPEYVDISALPFRGYNFIVNEYFLPEYLPARILFSKTDDGFSGDNMIPMIGYQAWDRWNSINTPGPAGSLALDYGSVGGVVWPVSRAHRSLWTSCLPKPSLETLNLLGTVDNAPVGIVADSAGTISSGSTALNFKTGTYAVGDFVKVLNNTSSAANSSNSLVTAKINEAVLTVNNYRETILLQNYYDCLNRSGSRYDEIIANLFHTRTSFAVISIPELIVHKRFTIYRKEVVSTAQTNNGSSVVKPIGSQGAYIDTIIRDQFFIKSTTEHGYIHMLFCIRPARIVMTSGFEPDWTNLNKLDQFYPQFQGMGDVPRKKIEVVYGFSGSYDSKTSILGYQEYSADDKYQRSSGVGWADPHTPNSMIGYVITDYYQHTNNVSLNNFYLSCASEEVQFSKCLAISDPTIAPQFMLDIRLDGEIIHPMKVYNIPGDGDLL